MLVVKVELHSAIDGSMSEIARMVIANDGTSWDANYGHYDCVALRGRSAETFDKAMRTGLAWQQERQARVENYPRKRAHVWNLVRRALDALDYRK